MTKTMDFLVNKSGWPSTDIASIPRVINISLEKRIIPRWSVVQILQAKGLVKNNLALATFLLPSERVFLEKFVIRFRDDVPQLLKVYQGKMSA
jgi:mTERF domain-containing protein